MEKPTTENGNAFDQACELLIKVGKAAHSYGSSGSRIESYLAHLASALGYRDTFRSTPTGILYGFGKGGGSPQRRWPRVRLDRCSAKLETGDMR